jgi:hypothetical protein
VGPINRLLGGLGGKTAESLKRSLGSWNEQENYFGVRQPKTYTAVIVF